jgi:alpha-tubulin suppressor-like RCC1 family protein
MSDGNYYDWGLNTYGQLGDGTTANSATPVLVSLPAPVRQVSQGGNNKLDGQTLVLLSNETVWGWGNDHFGQLGDGVRTSSSRPIRVAVPSGAVWTEVDSGAISSYALDSHGDLWVWGGDAAGQLGTGPAHRTRVAPKLVSGVSGLTDVSCTSQNVAAYSA